jgi:hypothetical protein
LLRPLAFDFGDDLPDRIDGAMSPGGEMDVLGALIAGVVATPEIPAVLHLPEQVVERLLGHAGPGRELGRALVLGAGVLQHVQMRGHQIGESALVQAGEHPVAYRLERDPQQRADQRWRRTSLGMVLSKVA